MTLRYALLALLEAGPMTGYELAKWFDQSVAYVWQAQHSQIYTELRKLETEGAVHAETLPRGEKATKRAYALTTAGAKQLRQWVSEVEQAPPLRDPAYVKATYFEYGGYRDARAQFRAHRKHYEALRDHYEDHCDQLEQRATPLLRRRLAKSPAEAHDAIVAYKVHAYRGLVERAKGEIAWAERGLELVDRLAAAAEDADLPVVDPSP
jgi:DNA-binding PadR family transcriptional regulator